MYYLLHKTPNKHFCLSVCLSVLIQLCSSGDSTSVGDETCETQLNISPSANLSFMTLAETTPQPTFHEYFRQSVQQKICHFTKDGTHFTNLRLLLVLLSIKVGG